MRGQETYRRSVKRVQRDHRKTHVIRPEDTLAARADLLPDLPAFDSKPVLSSIINESALFRSPSSSLKIKRNASTASTAASKYLSPFPNTPDGDSSVIATPFDEKKKDPDWGPAQDDGEKDWTKTPIGGLGKRRSKLANKSVSLF